MSRLRSSARAVASSSVRRISIPGGGGGMVGRVWVSTSARAARYCSAATRAMSSRRLRSASVAASEETASCAAASEATATAAAIRVIRHRERKKVFFIMVRTGERDVSVSARTPVAIALLGERRELRPLISRQAAPHAQQHDRAGLVHFSAGGLDDLDMIEDRGVVARLHEAVELLFSLIERLHPLAQRGLGFLEDFFKPGALFHRESELAPETLVLPPLTALGQGGGGAERQQG